jgi:hypothetical protein
VVVVVVAAVGAGAVSGLGVAFIRFLLAGFGRRAYRTRAGIWFGDLAARVFTLSPMRQE